MRNLRLIVLTVVLKIIDHKPEAHITEKKITQDLTKKLTKIILSNYLVSIQIPIRSNSTQTNSIQKFWILARSLKSLKI